MLLGNISLAFNAWLYKSLPYNAVRDLAPVSQLASLPFALLLHPSVAAKSVPELVALARARPGGLNYGTVGSGSGNHLTTVVFSHAAGVQAEHVPYKSASANMTDLASGRLTFSFATIPAAYQFIKAGRVRALGVSSLQRSSALPEVPTVAESGMPGFIVNGWYGMVYPAGVPHDIDGSLYGSLVDLLDEAFRLHAARPAYVGFGVSMSFAELDSRSRLRRLIARRRHFAHRRNG